MGKDMRRAPLRPGLEEKRPPLFLCRWWDPQAGTGLLGLSLPVCSPCWGGIEADPDCGVLWEYQQPPGEVDEVVSPAALTGEDNFASNQFFKCAQLKDCL